MKKIINGKLYDTETATRIASKSHGQGRRDFSYYEETLYRKRTGEYFLYGEGGPMSRYSVSRGLNEWSGGEKIIPLNFEKAREWGEENMDADDYQAEFGEIVEESSERVTMSISLDGTIADRIRREAKEKGLSVSALIASKF